MTKAARELPELRRYRVVLIDESHNLRNREGKRYRAIQEYLHENESKCILLSATPYNKSYTDLSSQLRLFVPEDKDLGTRPERLLKELGETGSSGATSARCTRSPRSRRAAMLTTGASSCGSTWSGGRAVSYRRTMPRPIPQTAVAKDTERQRLNLD